MKIEDFKIDMSITDSWGNNLIVTNILKTRVKLKIISLVKNIYQLEVGDIVTYDKAHLQFLKK